MRPSVLLFLGGLALLAAGLLGPAGRAQETPGTTAADTRQHQEITFAELPPHLVSDLPFLLAAKANSGLPVTFEVVEGPATIDGKTLRLSGQPGLVTVRARQDGNDLFAAAVPQERVFTVNPKPVAPAVVSSPHDAYVSLGEPIILEVRVTGEPLPSLQWRHDGRPIIGAQSRSLTVPAAALTDAGTYDVLVTSTAGSARSAPARVTVAKRAQTITFFPPPTAISGQTVMLMANASSGLPVHFEIVGGSGSLAGTVLTPNSNAVTLTATQTGDATYEAALPVTQTIQVQPGPQGQHY